MTQGKIRRVDETCRVVCLSSYLARFNTNYRQTFVFLKGSIVFNKNYVVKHILVYHYFLCFLQVGEILMKNWLCLKKQLSIVDLL